jgi:plasmid stabilization system protein ParE
MRVEISAEAERDLTAIGYAVARHDPQAAVKLVRDLRKACEGLSNFPERFGLVPRFENLGVRHRLCGNYLIFYRVERAHVVVLHVLHGARDYSDLLRTAR